MQFTDIQVRQFAYAGESFELWHYPSDASVKGSLIEIVIRDEYRLSRFRGLVGEVLLDVGANNGLVTLILAKLNPASTIVAVEPIRELCDLLERNLSANQIGNVRVVRKALHGDNQGVRLYVSNMCSGASSTHVQNEASFDALASTLDERLVDSITFDELVTEHAPGGVVYLLKIDCEGGEFHLPSSHRFLNLDVRFIEGEFHETAYGETRDGAAAALFDVVKGVVREEACVTVLQHHAGCLNSFKLHHRNEG
jgi:FkbM family methyltransferase